MSTNQGEYRILDPPYLSKFMILSLCLCLCLCLSTLPNSYPFVSANLLYLFVSFYFSLYVYLFLSLKMIEWLGAIQCDSFRLEQFQNGHFSWAYNFWTAHLEKIKSSEVIVSTKVSIFQLFPFDCITLSENIEHADVTTSIEQIMN